MLLCGSATPVYSEDVTPDPQALIDEMSKASRELNYDGIFVYRLGKQIDTMRIIHKSGGDGVYERLISLTGHAREVIRDKDQVKCFYPENKAVVVEKSRLGKLISTYLPNPIQSISEFYIFEIAGEDRIAGLDAWIVNIRPIDKFRYGYQIWIDKESRLLLKSDLKNQLGVTLEQIMFAQLNILEDIDDALLQPTVSGKDYTWYNNVKNVNLEVKNSDIQWKVTWMPAGFNMSEHEKELMMTSQMPVEHLVYTDGLAMVSIFVEKLNQQPSANTGPSNFGGVNTYATHADGYQITAVGEVPKNTVRLMADSVKSFH
jgi:sigma-E factor negative regulatory protein RseB